MLSTVTIGKLVLKKQDLKYFCFKKMERKINRTKIYKKYFFTIIKRKILDIGNTPDVRKEKLSRLIQQKNLRILESHSPLTGLIIENLKIEKKNNFQEFDGMVIQLNRPALRGKPDNQSVDYSTRMSGLNEVLDVTTKPIIFDVQWRKIRAFHL